MVSQKRVSSPDSLDQSHSVVLPKGTLYFKTKTIKKLFWSLWLDLWWTSTKE